MSKSNVTVKWITRTAILLAVLIVAQLILTIIPDPLSRQIITGSIVNFILLMSFVQVDVFGGVIVGLISPVIAFFIGIQALPAFIPFIMLGNAVYVAAFALIRGKKPNWIKAIPGVLVGALLKFTLLALSIRYLVVPPEKIKVLITNSMTFPQLITALIGGVLIILVEWKMSSAKK